MKSPLRYPGGKTRAIKILNDVLKYFEKPNKLLSPFCGGCSFEFNIKYNIPVICCDKFEKLIIFWNECKYNKNNLVLNINKYLNDISAIESQKTIFSKEKFYEIKNEINNIQNTLLISTYFFILNRCSFGGLTLSGGYSKESAEKRFTENSVKNIKKLSLDNYIFECKDFNDSLNNVENGTLIYCDPPYLLKKSNLYGIKGDLHENFNHIDFFNKITSLNNDWIISYNDCDTIRKLYKDYTIFDVNWKYGMNKMKNSSEIIIISKKITKGSIPHLIGMNFEQKVLNYFIDNNYNVRNFTANNKPISDIIVYKNDKEINIECKTKPNGVDYKQIKLEYINNSWKCDTKYSLQIQNIINNYCENLFNNEYPPINDISSINWNKYKKETNKFKDVNKKVLENNILEIILNNIDYIIFEKYGIYKIHDLDPLQLNVNKFYSDNFVFRFYIKNHSSSNAKKANLSVVCTLRLKTIKNLKKSNVIINFD